MFSDPLLCSLSICYHPRHGSLHINSRVLPPQLHSQSAGRSCGTVVRINLLFRQSPCTMKNMISSLAVYGALVLVSVLGQEPDSEDRTFYEGKQVVYDILLARIPHCA